MHEFVSSLPNDKPVVFVVGAFAHGKIDAPWVSAQVLMTVYTCFYAADTDVNSPVTSFGREM